jgi:L-lactate dehydrogenase
VLIDVDKNRARGEAIDLAHAAPFSHQARIWSGEYSDVAGAAVVIVTAGANQKPGQSRTELAKTNWGIFQKMIPEVVEHVAEDAVLVVSANPVDVLTYATVKFSGLPAERVVGSGTSLDSARFAYELAVYFGLDPASVSAMIVGEHGDSEIPVWSLATIAGMRLQDYCKAVGRAHNQKELDGCFAKTKNAAGEIIELKGVTGYGVATSLQKIVQAILRDENTLLPVSVVGSYVGVDDVALSLPRKITRDGAKEYVPLLLSEEEEKGLKASAQKLKDTIQELQR